jgi:hypothetical protein
LNRRQVRGSYHPQGLGGVEERPGRFPAALVLAERLKGRALAALPVSQVSGGGG